MASGIDSLDQSSGRGAEPVSIWDLTPGLTAQGRRGVFIKSTSGWHQGRRSQQAGLGSPWPILFSPCPAGGQGSSAATSL